MKIINLVPFLFLCIAIILLAFSTVKTRKQNESLKYQIKILEYQKNNWKKSVSKQQEYIEKMLEILEILEKAKVKEERKGDYDG